jgi:DNA helicase-2/ATP-dependent DNA helicase PcrA
MKERMLSMESLHEIVMYVAYQTGYLLMLEEEHDDIAQERIDNIKELTSVFVQGESFYEGDFLQKLSQLLDQIALYTDLDKTELKESVKLATFHQVKGLEFKVVFMTVMEVEIFPASQSTFDPRDMEEERRVAYVGVTRAKERLYLTRAEQRLLYGTWINPHPSRFLREMQPQKEVLTKPSDISREIHYLKAGDKVEHQVFGSGIVVNVEDDIATIAFRLPHGVKKILESHPSLKKITN